MLEFDVQDGVGVTGLQAHACGSRHFDTRGGLQYVSDPTAARWQSMVLFLAEFKRRDDETSGGRDAVCNLGGSVYADVQDSDDVIRTEQTVSRSNLRQQLNL